MDLNVAQKLDMFYQMLLIREFENLLSTYKNQHKIYGSVHCCQGEEGVSVGVCSALKHEDYVISNHRPHGHAIAKGVDIELLLAEILGKATGCCGGKGGSMHIIDPEVGMVMSTGIVGSGLPVACGTAFASRYKKDNKVTCVFFGDGAANEGILHECLNLAAQMKLPMVFVLEDNGLAVTTKTQETSIVNYEMLGAAYGISVHLIDGQDVEAVRLATERAVALARGGEPIMIHAKTIRFQEHAEGEYYCKMRTTGYRDYAQLNKDQKTRCPILLYEQRLINQEGIDITTLTQLKKKAISSVKECVLRVEQAPNPNVDEAFKNIYKGGVV